MSNDIYNPNIKNDALSGATEPDPLEEAYGYSYDENFGTEDTGGDFGGDLGIGGDGYFGPEGGSGAPVDSGMTVSGARQWLKELRDSGQITQGQYSNFLARANSSLALSGPAQAQALSAIQVDVAALSAPAAGADVGSGLGVDDSSLDLDPTLLDQQESGVQGDGGLGSEIQTFIDGINGNATLDQDTKDNFIQQAQDLMGQVTVAGDNQDALAPLEEKFSELQSNYQNFLSLPENAAQIAKALQIDPTTLMEAAQAHDIDLSKLPDPPTQEFMQFLEDLNPAIKKNLDAIKTTHDQKMAEVQKKTTEAQAISQNNVNNGTTNNNDNKDYSAHQFLYDAKYLQTSYDSKIRKLTEDVRGDIVDMLKVFYPDTKVKKVSANKIDQVYSQADYGDGGSDPTTGDALGGAAIGMELGGPVEAVVGAAIGGGIFGGTSVWTPPDSGTSWMQEANRCIAADKIQFGDVTLDLISGTTGEIQASTTPDSLDENITIVAVEYDGEGDGEWYPSNIKTYGDPTVPHGYDPDEGGASLPW